MQIAMPQFFDQRDEGIRALEWFLGILSAGGEEDLGLAFQGAGAILRTIAHFYLGQAYIAAGMRTKAQEHWRSVVLLDPQSNFAEMVYPKI